jgi:hypothetical protein
VIPHWRRRFNEQFTGEKYAAFLRSLEELVGDSIDFRPCETPVFIPNGLLSEIVTSSGQIISQLATTEYHASSAAAIPAQYNTPGEGSHPDFVVVDFAVTRDERGELRPKLIELQGWASLYAFQLELPEVYRAHFDLRGLEDLLSGLTRTDYIALLRQVIVSDQDPENVILMEIEPSKQKTRPDFVITRRLLGIETVCITDIIKRGPKLFYRKQGRDVEIRRIYNRVIIDELIAKRIRAPFDFRDDLEVEWAGHPNWFFRWSKYSLPFLDHPAVPRAWFLSDMQSYPKDLANYVLKPLFSFAGSGVRIDVTPADLDAIPENERRDYLVQKKITYEPVIETPDGTSKVEIRLMYLWPRDGERPVAVTSLTRLSKGLMLGVDFNKNKTWVGSSCGLFETAEI